LQALAECQATDRPLNFNSDGEGVWVHAWHPLALDSGFINEESRYGTKSTDRVEVGVRVALGDVLGLDDAAESVEAIAAGYVFDDVYHGRVPWIRHTDRDLGELVCYGYGATRRMGSVALSDQRVIGRTASLFWDDVTLMNAEEWLLQADYGARVAAPEQEQIRRRRDQVVQVLIDLLPGVNGIRFVFKGTPYVQFQVPYGWVRISQLSLGYRALIAWIVDLAHRMFERYPECENPLAEPAIVLVDEVDLHLHPKWQRSLIDFLTERFPKTQFIVTAHSPLIVQAAADANLVLLRRENGAGDAPDHVIVENDVEAIRGWRIDQVLTSDLFGLESARPPQFEKRLAERRKLLGKATLTTRDKARLRKLESEIGQLPVGETPDDIEAMDIIREAAAAIRGDRD